MVNTPAHDPGRNEAVETMAALLARPSTCRSCSPAPTPTRCWPRPTARPLVAVHVKDISDRDVMAEAALVSALEDRPVIFEGLEDIEPADRGRLLRAIETRPERTILAAPTRTAALALGERTVLLVEAAQPVASPSASRPGPTSPAAPRPATSPPSSGSR